MSLVLPEQAPILDAGCGSGRDALDASPRASAYKLALKHVSEASFEKLSWEFLVSASILEHFAPVPDFRIERNKLYPLPGILL